MATGAGGGGSGSGGAIRAGRAYVELGLLDKTSGIGQIIRGLGARLTAAGKSIARTGFGLIGGAGLAGGLGLKGVLDTLGETSQIKSAANALGITTEAASGLFGALRQAGGEFKEDLEGIVQFNQRVSDAINGVGGATGEAAKLFEGLSVQAKDLAGVPLDEKLYRVLDAIRQLPQSEQAARLALVGGSDSLKKWLPLLDASRASLRDQAAGMRQSAADIEAQAAAQQALTAASVSLDKIWQRLATALAPTIQAVAEGFARAAGPAAAWIGENREVVVTVAAVTAGVFGLGVALVGLGTVLSATGTVLGVVGTAVTLLGTPVGLAAAALAGLSAWFLTSTEQGQGYADWLTGTLGAAFESVAGTATQAWGGIADALQAGDLRLAAQIGLAGVRVVFQQAIAGLEQIWENFRADFLLGWEVIQSKVGSAARQLKADAEAAAVLVKFKAGLITQEEGDAQFTAIINARDELENKAKESHRQRLLEIKAEADLRKAEAENAGREEIERLREQLATLRGQAREVAVNARLDPLNGRGAGIGLNLPSAAQLGKLSGSITGFGGFGDTAQKFGTGGGVLQVLKQGVEQQKKIQSQNEKALNVLEAMQKGIDQIAEAGGLEYA